MLMRKKQKLISIVVGLIAIIFGTQFTSGPIQVLPSSMQMATPEPEVLLATANDAAATLGWSEDAQISSYGDQEYVTLHYSESTGNCRFDYYIVVGTSEIHQRATSIVDFHGYEAERISVEGGIVESIRWRAQVELFAEVSSYDCPPVDAMPIAEALYEAAARNGLLEKVVPPPEEVIPTPEEATLTVSVENNYTAIASDGTSELIIQAAVTGPVSVKEVIWQAKNIDSGEDITQQLSMRGSDPRNALAAFKPPETFDKPFNVRIEATVLTDQGGLTDSIDSVQIRVVRPPVILVHGIWSDRDAMLPLENTITRSDPMNKTHVSRVEYSASSYGDMIQNVNVLEAEVTRVLKKLNTEDRTRVSRVDIVAHSMGGLISRLYIENNAANVRKLITLATPHLGTPFADWYHELVENELQNCSGGIGTYSPSLLTKGDLAWFLTWMRNY